MRRQRLTSERWRELVGLHEGSGMSVSAFCEAHDLAASTFFAWRRRVGRTAEPTFVELTTSSRATASGSIELVLPCGVTVRVHAGFDAGLLRQVVEALS